MRYALSILFLFFSCSSFSQQKSAIDKPKGLIPIDGNRWYQLNTAGGIAQLFDGNLTEKVFTGWGKVLPQWDAWYPLLDGELMTIDSVRFYDGEGTQQDKPLTLSIINDKLERIPIAVFTGMRYNKWNGPDPNKPDVYALHKPVSNIRYLVLNSYGAYPAEIELYGSYAVPKPLLFVNQKHYPLSYFLGVNSFEWDFESADKPLAVDSNKLALLKGFTAIRHYLNWQKLENEPGKYTFAPVHSGGWNYDALYATLKQQHIEVLACIKNIPKWLQETYPADERDAEDVPAAYGKDRALPSSYIEQARMAFQFAARYGSNIDVDTKLLSVDDSRRWPADSPNHIRKGMGLIKYMECDNERDKWWKGRKAYQTGREYAANLSTFYDGNKNRMGAGTGVKNADPNMLVVMGGVAAANTDYLKGMIDWCKEYRGYKQDGSVNLAWDIINYHYYANNNGSEKNKNEMSGIAPEISNADSVANSFLNVAHLSAGDMPVWVTETGYDINPASPQAAIKTAGKSVEETQADWIIRTVLSYARTGVQRLFFYELYDDNPDNPQKYASCGLLNKDGTRRPAANFIYQLNKNFGAYTYQETISKYPLVDRYAYNDITMYAAVMPSETGEHKKYNLNIAPASHAKICTLQSTGTEMKITDAAVQNGSINIDVSETPVFIITYK